MAKPERPKFEAKKRRDLIVGSIALAALVASLVAYETGSSDVPPASITIKNGDSLRVCDGTLVFSDTGPGSGQSSLSFIVRPVMPQEGQYYGFAGGDSSAARFERINNQNSHWLNNHGQVMNQVACTTKVHAGVLSPDSNALSFPVLDGATMTTQNPSKAPKQFALADACQLGGYALLQKQIIHPEAIKFATAC